MAFNKQPCTALKPYILILVQFWGLCGIEIEALVSSGGSMGESMYLPFLASRGHLELRAPCGLTAASGFTTTAVTLLGLCSCLLICLLGIRVGPPGQFRILPLWHGHLCLVPSAIKDNFQRFWRLPWGPSLGLFASLPQEPQWSLTDDGKLGGKE